MAWARLDDGFHSHPDTLRCGLEANGLFARALSYCADYLTDGFVPGSWVDAQVGRRCGAVKQLLAANVFVAVEGGYEIPAYLEWNPRRTEVESKRDSDRKRKGFRPDSRRNRRGQTSESR